MAREQFPVSDRLFKTVCCNVSAQPLFYDVVPAAQKRRQTLALFLVAASKLAVPSGWHVDGRGEKGRGG